MLPFRSGRIVLGEDFCGRKEELARLREYLRPCNHVYVQGERRVGKSSLVCEAVRRMRGWRIMHVDLLAVKCVGDVTRRIVHALFAVERDDATALKLLKNLAALRPTFGVDPVTGQTSIGFASPKAVEAAESLEHALDLAASRRKTVLFFDEFQDVLSLPDSDQVIARMRSRIQLLTAVPVAFAGSLRNEMDLIFTDPASPFYKSAMKINLGPIDEEAIGEYMRKRFVAGGRKLDTPTVPAIYEITRGNPGDIQKLCIGLWEVSSPKDEVGLALIPKALDQLWSLEETNYEERLQSLSPQQLSCLRALSFIGETGINKTFVEETGIVLLPSVRRAMNGLVKKRILLREKRLYRICDPFFAAWIRASGI